MCARPETEELAIEHVRQRRQRMPVVGVNVGKSPDNVSPAQSLLNLSVLADVGRVIVIHESVSQGLSVDRPRDRDQPGANRDFSK